MAHELSTTADGRASMAYVGATPWHQLGQELTENAPLETWLYEAGLDWEAKLANVRFGREVIDVDGTPRTIDQVKDDSRVVYRSDTGVPLSVVSDRYRPVQPKQIIEFYRDLVDRWGFNLETAGALKGGRKIWALANTGEATQLRDRDETVRFLLDVYLDLGTIEEVRAFQADEKNKDTGEKLMKRLTTALFESPGAQLASARGTLWGVLNAVTYDVDHNKPARSQENRLDSAWFGQGNNIKQKAWSRALAMVA